MENTNLSELNWRDSLASGLVIPALPLTLHENGEWAQKHQQAVLRYYLASGAGGVAVGVHSTQFEIRNPKHRLFEPVLRLAASVLDRFAFNGFVRIAGICGETDQARNEAALAIGLGYHAGLLSLSAFCDQPDKNAILHVREIAKIFPVVGFYLQPAVGGRVLSYEFWRRFCEIENVVAIKIAPFNRYQTLDVLRAVIESGRKDITLYTGNDDNIIADLLTPFNAGEKRFIQGGLLGQWGIWTKRAVELLKAIKTARAERLISTEWLTLNAALTDANSAVFDAANGFAGCIPGVLEILRRQGLSPSVRCLNIDEVLSPGQSQEIDRVCLAYPELTDDDFVKKNLENWLEC